MIDLSQAEIKAVSIHQIGNQDNGTLNLSKSEIEINELPIELLTSYFLNPFKEKEGYQFDIEGGNLVYDKVGEVFNDQTAFHLAGVELAKTLFNVSESPAIKTGEFFVVKFSNCLVGDEITDAIGLFKSENKNTFLKIFPKSDGFGLEDHEGININKLDKGAIIFNTDQENGFLVNIIDQTNGSQAQYWKNGFLSVKLKEDNYYHTQQYIQMCRDFAMEELTDRNRGEKIGMVNEAVDFFKQNDQFDKVAFQEQVIRQPEIIEAFEDYSKNYELENHLNSVDEFEISPQAVKQSKKFVRSVIKLDKNFHLYVHGNRQNIERGFDPEKGKNFYKLYFDDEN
ncbi:MAG: nucleoid-associated protein [Cyclobacteriaceae bacterium]